MKKILFALLLIASSTISFAQQELGTGAQRPMPDTWIDKDTHHKLVRLTNKPGSNASYYFHNNPFIGNKMVFYSTDQNGKQMYTVDLATHKLEQITHQSSPMNGEIVGPKGRHVFYQIKDSVFSTNIDSKKNNPAFCFSSRFQRQRNYVECR